jgi:multidrug efflux system outer membrane protein
MTTLRFVVSCLLAVLISACMGLPAPHSAPSLATAAPLSIALNAQSGDWPAANWWQRYNDATLDALMTQAVVNAPSIASAEARFNSARESVRVSAAAEGLHVTAQGDVSRQRLSDNGLFPPQFLGFHWYNQADLGLQASYSFDWWHKRRSATYAAIDDARAAQAERSAAALTLGSAVADAYFGWQADQAQLALLREQLALAERRKAITQARIHAELEPSDGLHSLDAELAGLRESSVSLEYSAKLRRVMLAALLGINPEQLPTFTPQALPQVSTQLPANVHIDLLARRADISASRWQVEAAQQRLGVARAEFLPDITLNALAGLSSIDLAKLFNAGSAAPSVAAAIHLPIFDSGLLKAQYGARAAQLDAAIASYNDTLVTAAREVATQTLRLQQLAAQHTERDAQTTATQRQVEIATRRGQQGLSDARPALLATQALQQQRAALSTLDAQALSTEIGLIAALGGGYAVTAASETAAP